MRMATLAWSDSRRITAIAEPDAKAWPNDADDGRSKPKGRKAISQEARSTNSARNSIASAQANSLNLRGPAGSGLPPSPPTSATRPQEVDGQERNGIRIHFTGETPRHLGFQVDTEHG